MNHPSHDFSLKDMNGTYFCGRPDCLVYKDSIAAQAPCSDPKLHPSHDWRKLHGVTYCFQCGASDINPSGKSVSLPCQFAESPLKSKCVACNVELSTTLDAYYGHDAAMKYRCVKCRPKGEQ